MEQHNSPLKLLIKDLSSIVKHNSDSEKPMWQITIGKGNPFIKTLFLSEVWVQGYVICCQANGMKLSDGSGEVMVLTKDIHWIKEGLYCAVIGKFVQSSSQPEALALCASRVLDLSYDRDFHEGMWPLEVKALADLLSCNSSQVIDLSHDCDIHEEIRPEELEDFLSSYSNN